MDGWNKNENDQFYESGERRKLASASTSGGGHGQLIEDGDPSYSNQSGSSRDDSPMVVLETSILKPTLMDTEDVKEPVKIEGLTSAFQEVNYTLKGWDMMQSFHGLLMEEKDLEVTVNELKKSMCKANRDICRKEKDCLKLSRRIRELQLGEMETEARQEKAANVWEASKDALGMTEDVARIDPLLILPEEVWRIILKNVADPKDLWNLCNSCQLFDDILHQRKMEYMFKQALPYLYGHLPGNKILECRQICKDWNVTVLNFHQEHPSFRPHTGWSDPYNLNVVNSAKEKGLCVKNVIDFFSTERHVPLLDDAEFQSTFAEGQNPFIDRYVVFHIGEEDYEWDGLGLAQEGLEEEQQIYDQLWTRVYKFLQYFGKHIWYLSVNLPLDRVGGTSVKVCQFTKDILQTLAPDLRKLHWSWTNLRYDIPANNPRLFPLASHLETLDCSSMVDDALFAALLLRYHMQLRKVVANPAVWNEVRHLEWPKLTELYIRSNQEVQDCLNQRLYEVRMPNLSRLGVEVSFIFYYQSTFEKLLEIIHSTSATTFLNTLVVTGPIGALEEIGNPELSLILNHSTPSSLKTLIIDHRNTYELKRVWNGPSYYDFLLQRFPLLENLHVYLRDSGPEDRLASDPDYETDLVPLGECAEIISGLPPLREEIVELRKYMGWGNMYDSNIWEFLPQLKVFSFQWNVFTREGCEGYLNKKQNCNIN